MQHSVIVGAALAILAASSGLQAQDGSWVETKFHRIHLLNGNFIDGNLIGESDRALVMRIGGGEMQIRKDMIDRNSKGSLRVEYVKMRSYKEAPKLETMRLPKGPVVRETPPSAKDPKTPPPSTSAEAVTLTGTSEDQLAQAGDILKNGTVARKKGAIQALAPIGSEAALFLASILASLEDELVPVAGAVLFNIKEPKVLPTIKPLMSSDRARLREQAVTLVGGLGNARDDGDSARNLLRDLDTEVRGAAIVALERLSDADAFDLIAESLTDPDSGIRNKALSALTSFSQQAGLSEKLSDTVGRALSQAQGQAREDLMKAASGMGSKQLGPLMARLATDNEPMVRAYAIQSLGKLNSPDHIPLILERFGVEREYWPRIQLAGAAQAMRMSQAIDPLIEWLGDEDTNIRSAAIRALRAITGQNVGSDKASWEEWRQKSKQ